MTLRSIAIAALLLATVLQSKAQTTTGMPVHIGLVYPLSTNGINAARCINGLSMHAIAGISGGEKAFCASGVSNIILGDAHGLSAAGFSNHIRGNARGLVVSGFLSQVRQDMKGVQAAGFLNTAGNVEGAQFAGFANITSGKMKGIQAAGFLNISEEVNTQVAGFINIAGKVKGVQIAGFMNIADSSEYPIGLINIVKKGEMNLGITIDETGTIIMALRSGGRVLYGILGTGLNFKDHDPLYAMEGGLGAHLRVNSFFRINGEVIASGITGFLDEIYFKSSFRLTPALRMGRNLEVFAGPTFSYTEHSSYNRQDLNDHYFWSTTEWGRFHGLSLGFLAGVHVVL